ncbi:MAG TPA: S-adenosylmethionine:tRNA ribosyltransferase-isomerase [Bacteroidales bacterium]|nr:S-adenosylmethionine:tRNA ribosyltransferase-isomerase [Bacteroidales bacterium]
MIDIDLSDYNYELPPDRIAQHPVKERDSSKLLISDGTYINEDKFRNLARYLPAHSLLVFNNTRVIQARILFRKESGADIEILCLEPLDPPGYDESFSSFGPVEWKCMVGNLKKWKRGPLTLTVRSGEQNFILSAEKVAPEGDAYRIRFTWYDEKISFSEILESVGHIPLPPYISRPDSEEDRKRYQTVYSIINGSVAAPTAGLHFTGKLLNKLINKGIDSASVTLHVGAGTFRPVKTESIAGHEMHCEHYFVTLSAIEMILRNRDNIIAVGTTSVRTLESLYWTGVKLLLKNKNVEDLMHLGQWEAYGLKQDIPLKDSLEAVIYKLTKENKEILEASTSLIIVPGYKFRVTGGMITNFHQPGSTLLLLVSAWTGPSWKKIYKYALENDFRFLSYGDSSLLLCEKMLKK